MKLNNLITITCDGGAATEKFTGAKLIVKIYVTFNVKLFTL